MEMVMNVPKNFKAHQAEKTARRESCVGQLLPPHAYTHDMHVAHVPTLAPGVAVLFISSSGPASTEEAATTKKRKAPSRGTKREKEEREAARRPMVLVKNMPGTLAPEAAALICVQQMLFLVCAVGLVQGELGMGGADEYMHFLGRRWPPWRQINVPRMLCHEDAGVTLVSHTSFLSAGLDVLAF